VNREQILQLLQEERDRLARAIEALGGEGPSLLNRAGLKRAGKKGPGGITAAGRKRLSELMKKRWAERRKKAG